MANRPAIDVLLGRVRSCVDRVKPENLGAEVDHGALVIGGFHWWRSM
jgi:hypothetical protein